MELKVTTKAAQKLSQQMHLKNGDRVKIFTKIYGGIPTVFPSYFLGIVIDNEDKAEKYCQVEGIEFYVTQEDEWILDDYDLKVILNNDEVEYHFVDPNNPDVTSGASK